MKAKACSSDKVVRCLKNNQTAEAIGMMKLWSNEQLGQFLLSNISLRSSWIGSDFSAFWTDRLSQLRVPSKSTFRFMPQPNVLNADLVTGYLIYLLELQARNQGQVLEGKDSGLIFFYLMRKHLHDVYLLIPQYKTQDMEQLSKVLYNLEQFAKEQGCPGYLLLANGYLQLAVGFQRQHNMEHCELSFNLCWKYLHLAALSEKDSIASINNAYFGEGIILATPFKLASISEMKNHCLKAAGDVLTATGQKGAEQAAERMYQKASGSKEEEKESGLGMRI